MSDVNFPLTWKSVLPGYFDEVLFDLGVITGAETFADLKPMRLIDNAAVGIESDTYSTDLRTSLGL
jgi:hypothetical protein